MKKTRKSKKKRSKLVQTSINVFFTLVIILVIIGLIKGYIIIDNNKSSNDNSYMGFNEYMESADSSGLSSNMKEKLDLYEDRIYECSLQASNLMYSEDWISSRSKLNECKRIVDEAIVQINAWSRDENSNEIRAAKLDYYSTLRFFEACFLLLNIKEEKYNSPQEAVNKLNMASNLLNQALDKLSEFKQSYSHTEYYERYYESKLEEAEEGEEQLKEIKFQIDEILNYYNNLECSEGYVLGEDYICHLECNGGYCNEDAICCGGGCYSCPSGYYLATDCFCYPY